MYQHWHYWVRRGEDREKGVENQFDKIMTKNFQTWKRKQISQYRKTEGPKQGIQTDSKAKKYHN